MQSIDDEFAALEAEIARLTQEAPKTPKDGAGIVQALEALKAEWAQKTGDRPDWRRRVDEAITRAIDRVLQAGQAVDAHGNLAFTLDGQAVQTEGREVLHTLVDGLAQAFVDKWQDKPGEPPPENRTFDATDLAGLVSLFIRPKLKDPAK